MRQEPLDIYQGDDYGAFVTVTVDGTPADLTGYDVTAQIRRKPADTDATVDAELACVVDGNIIEMTLSHDITETLSGTYVWDLQLTDGTGGIQTIARGPVYVTAEVTRP